MAERTFGRETKFQQVRAGLETLAHQLGPDARFPPVRELVCQFGAGVNTVSGALQDLEARDIVYRRERVGVFVSPTLSRTICFLMAPDFFARGHAPFWDSLLRAAQLRAEKGREKFELHLAQSAENLGEALEENLEKRLGNGRVSGVVGVGLRDEAVQWFQEKNVPFVSLFGPCFGGRGASVLMDSHAMIDQGLRHLASLGCTRIECWTSVPAHLTRAQIQSKPNGHHDTAFATLEKLGRPLYWRSYADTLSPDSFVRLSTEEQGFELARSVFSAPRERWPDGIFCIEDRFTQGVLMALQGEGVQVGKDVQIATHANSDTPTFIGHRVPFWLFEYDISEIVETAHSTLEGLMRGQQMEARWVRPHLRQHRS